MNLRTIVYVMAMQAVLITAYAEGNQMKVNSSAQSTLDALATNLSNKAIAKIEILQIPARVLTRVRINPEMLEKQFHYKLTIRDARGEIHEKELLDAVKSTKTQPQSEMPDLRWGVIFYGLDNSRVGAIYFDAAGTRSVIDNAPVSLKGDLFKVIENDFAGCFK